MKREAQTIADALHFSRLMLGTVQFGLDYGVANRAGQPAYNTAREILACAIEHGVNCFDTAAAYGGSEVVLGRALRELGARDRVTVVTKVPPLPAGLNGVEARAMIEAAVRQSMKRLGLDVLPVCLFHREENLCYLDALLHMRALGLIQHIGISATSPAGARQILVTGGLEALQIPVNMLDRRFAAVSAEAAAHGLAVFARSVYLQGLLLMADEETPRHMAPVIPVRRRLSVLAGAAGMNLAELALRYALSLPELRCVLVGVDSVAQMKENLALFRRGPLPTDVLAAIRAVAPDLPVAIINPVCWPKERPGGARAVIADRLSNLGQ